MSNNINKREIISTMYYKSDAKYDIEWKDNKINWKSVYISWNFTKNDPNLNGIKYKWEFKNNKIEG